MTVSVPSPLERLAGCLRGQFSGDINWFELISTANEQLVAPSLYRKLATSDMADRVEPEALAFLKILDQANRERNQSLWELVCETVREFNAAGISPTLIKGASEMAVMARPEDYARMLIDVDLLIEPGEFPAARETFERLGFEVLDGSVYDHSPGSYWRPGSIASVDLHTSFSERISSLLTEEDHLERFHTIERDGLRCRLPDDSMKFLINISHDMLHHTSLMSGATNLRYILPLAEQAESPDSRIDWNWLCAKRADWRFRLAFDLQMEMLRYLFSMKVAAAEKPGLAVRFLHLRRLLKARHPQLGSAEWQLVRHGMSAVRFAGIRIA